MMSKDLAYNHFICGGVHIFICFFHFLQHFHLRQILDTSLFLATTKPEIPSIVYDMDNDTRLNTT